MICPVYTHARNQNKNKICLQSSKNTFSYHEVNASIQNICYSLSKQGIKAGDRVLLEPCNSIKDISFYFACLRLGAQVVLLNPKFPDKKKQELLKTIKIKSVEKIFLNGRQSIQQKHSFLLRNISNFMLTSGSSGDPKWVVHTIGNHYYSARGSETIIPLTPKDTWVWSVPMYHVSGLSILWRVFLAGATLVIPETSSLPEKATHISFVPAQLRQFLENKKDIQTLRRYTCILLGGAPIDQALLKKNLPIFSTYGLTEMASQVITQNQILPYRQVRIKKDHSIEVRGRVLFKGYYRNGRVQKQKGWFKTGDLGCFDGGEFNVFGRQDRMFISGGENIYPEEIERVISSVPGVERVVIEAFPDETYGTRPVAYVRKNASLSIEDIKKHISKQLLSFQVPDRFEEWPKDGLVDKGTLLSRASAKAVPFSL